MKKSICVFNNLQNKGGGERVASQLMNELSRDNDVLCLIPKNTNKRLAYVLDKNIKIEILSSSQKNLKYNPLKLIFLILKVYKLLSKNQINIIINVGSIGVIFSYFISIFTDIKIIYAEQSNLNNKINNNFSQKLCQFFATKFNKIITLTEKDKINYIQKFNLSETKVDYIYNFIDDELLNLKNEYNLDSKKIITVGRFDKVKGYDRLVKIAKKVLEKNKDWEWHIYGDGEEFKNIETLIKEKQLENKLILKGKVDNIYELYKEYSFYVMTSYYEGLPMVLLEAKANNLPLISFDIETGPSEIIRNEIDGYLIENNNLEQMTEKINYLIKNENIREKFSDRSKENLDKFKKDKIINQWLNLIENI